jgi:uncharacterized Zn finger protein (UPF0148 family)
MTDCPICHTPLEEAEDGNLSYPLKCPKCGKRFGVISETLYDDQVYYLRSALR